MNNIEIEAQSSFANSYLDDITIKINGEDHLQIDSGRAVSKTFFFDAEDLLELFITFVVSSGMDLERTFDARAILGEKIRTDSRFRYHASRSLAFMAESDLFEIICINPDVSGANRYKVVPDKTQQRH